VSACGSYCAINAYTHIIKTVYGDGYVLGATVEVEMNERLSRRLRRSVGLKFRSSAAAFAVRAAAADHGRERGALRSPSRCGSPENHRVSLLGAIFLLVPPVAIGVYLAAFSITRSSLGWIAGRRSAQ